MKLEWLLALSLALVAVAWVPNGIPFWARITISIGALFLMGVG